MTSLKTWSTLPNKNMEDILRWSSIKRMLKQNSKMWVSLMLPQCFLLCIGWMILTKLLEKLAELWRKMEFFSTWFLCCNQISMIVESNLWSNQSGNLVFLRKKKILEKWDLPHNVTLMHLLKVLRWLKGKLRILLRPIQERSL